MNFSPKDSKLLHFWQSRHFDTETQGKDDAGLSRKADSLRSLMTQVDVLSSSSSISSFGRDHLLQQYADKYCKLVDEQDNNKGLNNFAEPVLSLVAGHNNDSENWKSSLSLEEFKKTSLWQEIVNKDKQQELRKKFHPIPSSTITQGQEDTAPFPIEPKEKDWSINITTGHAVIDQAKSKPPVNGIGMDDNMSNKRKLHFVYPSDYPETSNVKFHGSNQESRPHPWSTGLPQPPESTNKYNRLPLSSKDNQEPNRFSNNNDDNYASRPSKFITAKQQYIIDSKTKNQKSDQSNRGGGSSGYGGNARKTLGTRRGPSHKFVPPVPRNNSDEESSAEGGGFMRRKNGDTRDTDNSGIELDERLKNIEPKMVELIMNEIMDHGPPITWNDIAGLEFAKNVIKEIVVWPMLRPDIFKGLRGPPKGLLLFGPPGTGKTLIGKCIASQSKATFFSISASSLTSKWVGEGEKMVRALFAVARCHLPAVIFIDEIDSLLTQRTDGEHEASRRIKTEFLVQLDGATTNTDERLLVVGATNRPQEIDEAARRRLVKRLYIPLPDASARQQIICNLLSQQSYSLTDKEIGIIVTRTEGYSGSDMSNLCREAAIGPIRCLATADIEHISADQVRPIELQDFESALSQVRASVSDKDLNLYTEWNTLYGSGSK